jgi:hypothetical protein
MLCDRANAVVAFCDAGTAPEQMRRAASTLAFDSQNEVEDHDSMAAGD